MVSGRRRSGLDAGLNVPAGYALRWDFSGVRFRLEMARRLISSLQSLSDLYVRLLAAISCAPLDSCRDGIGGTTTVVEWEQQKIQHQQN